MRSLLSASPADVSAERAGVRRASLSGGKVDAEPPGTGGFDRASSVIVADVAAVATAASAFFDAGFTDVALSRSARTTRTAASPPQPQKSGRS